MKRNFYFLFVCTGDTCRSPLAVALFRNQIKKMGIKGLSCGSAGLFVSGEKEMTAGAKNALKFLGIRAGKHKATQIDADIVKRANIILTMTADHKESLAMKFGCADKTFVLSEFADDTREVSDPYGKSAGEYIKCAQLLQFLIERLIVRLKNEGIING